MSTIILLGAGASFGSEGVTPYPPPLGNKLFSELEKLEGIAKSLPDDIKAEFNNNFEAGMAKYYKHSNGDIMQFQRELASYLANFSPLQNNVYVDLLKSIKLNRVIFSSLNYDLLLELSALGLGHSISYNSTPVKGALRLLKIHGSSNFWPDLPVGMCDGLVAANNGKGDISAPVKPLNQKDTLYRCGREKGLAPAIAMFAEGKSVRVSPEFVDQQYSMWKSAVEKASKIFVIGVRVHEVDEHIWNVFGQSKAWFAYFGFNGDKPEFNDWKNRHNKKNAYFYENDFKSSVEIIKNRTK